MGGIGRVLFPPFTVPWRSVFLNSQIVADRRLYSFCRCALLMVVAFSVPFYMLSRHKLYGGVKAFIYLTNITYILTGIWAMVTISCIAYAWLTVKTDRSALIFEYPRLAYWTWVTRTCLISMHTFITIVFWIGFTNDTEAFLDVWGIISHGCILFVPLLDSLLSPIPVLVTHILPAIAFGWAYIFFGLIYYLAGGVTFTGRVYIYPAFDFSTPRGQAICWGVGAIFCFVALPSVAFFWTLIVDRLQHGIVATLFERLGVSEINVMEGGGWRGMKVQWTKFTELMNEDEDVGGNNQHNNTKNEIKEENCSMSSKCSLDTKVQKLVQDRTEFMNGNLEEGCNSSHSSSIYDDLRVLNCPCIHHQQFPNIEKYVGNILFSASTLNSSSVDVLFSPCDDACCYQDEDVSYPTSLFLDSSAVQSAVINTALKLCLQEQEQSGHKRIDYDEFSICDNDTLTNDADVHFGSPDRINLVKMTSIETKTLFPKNNYSQNVKVVHTPPSSLPASPKYLLRNKFIVTKSLKSGSQEENKKEDETIKQQHLIQLNAYNLSKSVGQTICFMVDSQISTDVDPDAASLSPSSETHALNNTLTTVVT